MLFCSIRWSKYNIEFAGCILHEAVVRPIVWRLLNGAWLLWQFFTSSRQPVLLESLNLLGLLCNLQRVSCDKFEIFGLQYKCQNSIYHVVADLFVWKLEWQSVTDRKYLVLLLRSSIISWWCMLQIITQTIILKNLLN